MPQTTIVFLMGTLSLAGIPLFGGFLSKEEILGAVWAGGLTVPFVMLLVGAFLTAFYMIRVVFLTFFGAASAHAARHEHGPRDAHDAHAHGPAHDAPAIMTLPLWMLALVVDGDRHLLHVPSLRARVRQPGVADAGGGRRWRSPASVWRG